MQIEDLEDFEVGELIANLVGETLQALESCSMDESYLCEDCFNLVHSNLILLKEIVDGEETSN